MEMNKEKESHFGDSPNNLVEITKRCERLEYAYKEILEFLSRIETLNK
jgi:hypothetical protein